MVILPLSIARVSNLLQNSVATQNIGSTQSELVTLEQELSTGRQISQPSDNPSSAAVIQQLQKTLDYSQQYSTNITQGTNQLSEVDSTLGNVTTLLTQAQSIASANTSNTVSAEARANAATVVDSIYNQILTIANKQYGGTYLFGADAATSAPYNSSAGGIEFVGGSTTLQNTFEQNTQLSFQVKASEIFGGESGSISTGTNNSPAIGLADRISDLSGANGHGVKLGSIQIGNGATTATVDLTNASSVDDVIAQINAAGLAGLTASATQFGIQITATGGAAVSVKDLGGGSAALDLGILQPTAGAANATLAGANLGSKITPFTPVAALNGGAGIDPTGFTIASGTASKTITLVGVNTVEDLINAVNKSGIGVHASINAQGTGIDLTNATQGSSIKVSENGGTTAAQLGFRTFSPLTALASLNNGKGVSLPTGNLFSVTTADGTITNIALTNAKTVADVINQINTSAGGKVTATFAATGNGLVLTDNTTGPGTLGVASISGSTTAADLGLTTAAVAGKVVGTDVNPIGVPGIFSDLQKLRDSLRSNSTGGITDAAQNLQTDSQTVTDVNASVGARVQELASRSNDLTGETLANKTLLSKFQDVDYTTAITQYQTLQTGLQASLQVTAKSLNVSLLNYIG